MMTSATQDVEEGRQHLELLRRVTARLSQLTRASLAPSELTNQQAVGLIIIADRAGLTQAMLAQAMYSDANTISSIVRRLEHRGLIKRAGKDGDNRAYVLSTTPKGEKCAMQARRVFDTLAAAIVRTTPVCKSETITGWLRSVILLGEL